jgi:enamine deaminase RidA (YjgF/YER057c/UK114 family)
MPKTVINPPALAKPTGYSYAIKKSGTPVFISGQVALDAEGKLVGENDAAAQTEQVFKNLQAVVEGCGGTMNDIVKITIFVTDPSYRPAVAAARLKWFKEGEWPASTYLVVSALAVPTMLVEIEAVAMV